MARTKSKGQQLRTKISTTVAPETIGYLKQLISSGNGSNLAEALDALVVRIRRLENRKRLADATREYFAQAGERAIAEEAEMAGALSSSLKGLDFDAEL